MAILDIDIGNSRLKWRCGELRGALLHDDNWQPVVSQLAESPVRVRVANVAGDALADRMRQWAGDNWELEPEFAVTGNEAAGVRCGYPDPSQLGVDRWLAILASHHKHNRHEGQGLVVVSAGSAVTVDLLLADGEHLGGYIVPGLELQRGALFAGTSQVKVAGNWRQSDLKPGRNTEQAVLKGGILMTVALVEEARRVVGGQPPIVLAGGDAESLLPHLPGDVQLEPDLVLDGLSVLMP